jgi:hypothetical protein
MSRFMSGLFLHFDFTTTLGDELQLMVLDCKIDALRNYTSVCLLVDHGI